MQDLPCALVTKKPGCNEVFLETFTSLIFYLFRYENLYITLIGMYSGILIPHVFYNTTPYQKYTHKRRETRGKCWRDDDIENQSRYTDGRDENRERFVER